MVAGSWKCQNLGVNSDDTCRLRELRESYGERRIDYIMIASQHFPDAGWLSQFLKRGRFERFSKSLQVLNAELLIPLNHL